ncbi:hypothetical protein HU200_058504 [Digitaria exilis]|uniref:Uncharacterized protein n=1 Tax=Digitaria exilis TaxID=1010633 RepID=A0A835AHN5_9POAL|nr:hypothetical protein HU200_058504 [Digitaria exilis]
MRAAALPPRWRRARPPSPRLRCR